MNESVQQNDPNIPLPLETPKDFVERSGLGIDRAWEKWIFSRGHTISRSRFRRAVKEGSEL